MHSRPSKHGIHIISSVSSTYGSNAYIRSILDFEAIFPDARYGVRNGYARQAIAIIERIIADACHGIRNRHARQSRAAKERTPADGRHGVRNRYARQARATRERTLADARYGARNRHARQARAVFVFASLLLSIIYILNGRKVIAWIL